MHLMHFSSPTREEKIERIPTPFAVIFAQRELSNFCVRANFACSLAYVFVFIYISFEFRASSVWLVVVVVIVHAC